MDNSPESMDKNIISTRNAVYLAGTALQYF
jgi:hypothetical protein